MTERTCSLPRCEYPHQARGYCTGHYQRFKRHGDACPDLPLTRTRAPEDWLLNVRKPLGEDGCWYWRRRSTGYPTIKLRGVQHQVHRLMYERFIGPIPPGHVIDHICHNASPDCTGARGLCQHRLCVNPAHLEAVTQRENVTRGKGLAGVNSRKAACKRGHPLAPPNVREVIHHRSGHMARVCLECERMHNRLKYERYLLRRSA